MTGNDPAVEVFWRSFVSETGIDGAFTAWSFGNDPEMADQLGRLVRDGPKRATTSLLSAYQDDGEPLPKLGDLSVVLGGGGEPLCVIRTVGVEVRPFGQVDERSPGPRAKGTGAWGTGGRRTSGSSRARDGRSTRKRLSSWRPSSCCGRSPIGECGTTDAAARSQLAGRRRTRAGDDPFTGGRVQRDARDCASLPRGKEEANSDAGD